MRTWAIYLGDANRVVPVDDVCACTSDLEFLCNEVRSRTSVTECSFVSARRLC